MKKITRREFISTTAKVLATVPIAGTLGMHSRHSASERPNFLLIMVDQMQTPPQGYSADEGAVQHLKEILGFKPLSPDNQYTRYFPGLMRLRQNSVVMRKHYTASAACVPSRTCIMTGQYSSVTDADQTDGLFKSDSDVPWLDPDGTPTIGDWFKAIGYNTHYFGKWHVSEVEEGGAYLTPYGFNDWDKSYPEPHGGQATNLGVNRDIQFADLVEEFLTERGADRSGEPWFAVGSLVDPHDCSAWPINWQIPDEIVAQGLPSVVEWQDYPPPVPIPSPGDIAEFEHVDLNNNSQPIPLNPDGFPQDNSDLPPTFAEAMDTKPRCQRDYALKWQLGLKASQDILLKYYKSDKSSAFPFALQDDPGAWQRAYNQFYFYCTYLADRQICKMLDALDQNGLADNTIVVFLSDHGEMAGAHGGMIQKWHNAYEEVIRVPMVVSSPVVNKDRTRMREIEEPTSSIDFVPTMLGLAGLDSQQLRTLVKTAYGTEDVTPFAGADLSAQIKGTGNGPIIGPHGKRDGVFFMTNDMITELGESEDQKVQYELFLTYVKVMQKIPGFEYLEDGPVVQPNNVRAFCTGDWKIVHYVDPNGVESDEWELYCLKTDPVEAINLVDYRTGLLLEDVSLDGYSRGRLNATHLALKKALARHEAEITG